MSVASEIARLQNAKASIKTAIENKGVTVGDIKLDAYSAKIDEISTGVEPTGTLEITQNGTYDVKQKAYAEVAVPEPSGNIKITENGFHIIKQYSIAEVAVYPTLIAKTILANGTYNASDDNVYGYGSVSVNVPEKKLGTKTINANGDYNATEDSLDGYSNVSVSVPEKTLTTKTITANGTYNATDDNADGYSQVTVETSGVDINDYYDLTKKSSGGINKYIKQIPLIDTSDYTSMYNMFNGYSSLITIPQLDTSKVTDMDAMFSSCVSLKEIPLLNTSKVTSMNAMFNSCSGLSKIPSLDTSQVTDIETAFQNCRSLVTIPKLNFARIQRISISTFLSCDSLENVGGFADLGKLFVYDANNYHHTVCFSYSAKLTHESLMNIINYLYDISSKKTQQLELGSTNLAKLTAEEIAIATNKGWNVS